MNYNFLRKLLAPLVRFLWPLDIINIDKFVEQKGVYVCNHYSAFDPVHLATDLFANGLNAMVKAEAIIGPISKWFLLGAGAIPVKREETDLRAIKQAMSVLRQDKSLIIFPEGTRNKEGSKELLPFKDGPVVFAVKNKTHIHPMLYYKPLKFFKRNYLIIGDTVDLSEYYDRPINDIRESATSLVRFKMDELRYEIDSIVEDKEKLAIWRKNNKAMLAISKKANRQAKKLSRKVKKDSINVKVEE